MKQKDIALIIGIAGLSAIFSFVISGKIFTASTTSQQVEVVDAIQPSFNQPDKTYFNANSIDPTQLITIGPNNSSTNPFSGTGSQ